MQNLFSRFKQLFFSSDTPPPNQNHIQEEITAHLHHLNITFRKVMEESLINPAIGLGVTQAELDQCSDIFSGQPPLVRSDLSSNTEAPNPVSLMGELKNYWKQLEDPLDPRILDLMDQISDTIQDTKRDFRHRYTVMVGIASDDAPVLIDNLGSACMLGPATIINMIKIATTAYSIAKARNASAAIEQIATVSTDMKEMNMGLQQQQGYYLDTFKHHILSWNSLNASMTKLMGELDRRILTLSQPGGSTQRAYETSPSLSSRGSPDVCIDNMLTLTSGFEYRCHFGVLKCLDSSNLSFIAETTEGIPIANFVSKVKSLSPISALLNKDLDLLSKMLHKNQTLASYGSLSKDEKYNFLKGLANNLPLKPNQWTKQAIP